MNRRTLLGLLAALPAAFLPRRKTKPARAGPEEIRMRVYRIGNYRGSWEVVNGTVTMSGRDFEFHNGVLVATDAPGFQRAD